MSNHHVYTIVVVLAWHHPYFSRYASLTIKPQNTTKYHKIPQKTTKNHKKPQKTTKNHKKPQKTTKNHKNGIFQIFKPLLASLWFSQSRKKF
jgi:hypothetical protein